MKVCFWKCGKASGGKIKSPLYCYNGEVLLFFLFAKVIFINFVAKIIIFFVK